MNANLFPPWRYTSWRHLLQVLEEEEFAKETVAPEKDIAKSSFFEAINTQGVEQLREVFEKLQLQAANILPGESSDFGNLISIDGSLINGVLSMDWAN
jgi:hypothetical protein